MISATQIRKGMVIRINDRLFRVEEMKHITPGKGNAIVQTKIRDIQDLTIRDHRFRSSEKVDRVVMETREYAFSYQDGDNYVFMDNETYEQLPMNKEFLGDLTYYIKENEVYQIEFFEGTPMNITPPLSMEFTIVETEKALKGATVQASYKPAVLDNDMEIMVPPFVEEGSVIRVDTRDGSYIERVSK